MVSILKHSHAQRLLSLGWLVALGLALFGCEDSQAVSEAKAKDHVQYLLKTIKQDVAEVRRGLPEGAEHLKELFEQRPLAEEHAQEARAALERARSRTQDLRIAKSTFFAVVTPEGKVIRNDREQDRMAGQNLFKHFPELKQALQRPYVETRGSMPEAASVKGSDGQWVAAVPVKVEEELVGLYVTGWSWSAYAYRLETGLRSAIRSDTEQGEKMPLVYVYLVVDDEVYGAPVSPRVNAEAIKKLDPLKHATQQEPFSAQLEITAREYGLAVAPAPELGKQVGVAVLRSET